MENAAPVNHVVAYCDNMSSDPTDWTEAPQLWCEQLTIGVSPTIDQGSLHWHYGELAPTGEESAYVAPLAIEGKYVRITVEELDLVWYGYVLKSQTVRSPQETVADVDRMRSGEQLFTVVGLEWFLDREVVNFSKVSPNLRIERAIGFNTGFGNGRGVTYEKRANKKAGSLKFGDDPTAAELWDGFAAISYLLAEHNPRNSDNQDSPVPFVNASGNVDFLSWFKPSIQTEGKTVKGVLDEIASRSRGLVWWLEVELVGSDESATLQAFIKVDSMSTSDVSLPGGATLPSNTTPVTLTDIDSGTDGVVVIKDLARHYDRVICRGARKRAVFTVSPLSGNFKEHWGYDYLRLEYNAALGDDPVENDRYRQAARFEPVYQYYRIPEDWDGKSNDGSAPPSLYACPKIAQGGDSIIGAEPMAMPGLRILGVTPLKQGVDYTDATNPTGDSPVSAGDEWVRPFGVANVDGKWRFMHELAANDESGGRKVTSYVIRPLDSVAGIQISPRSGMPHCLLKDLADAYGEIAPSEYEPEIDITTCRFTLAGEWDAYCEGMFPLSEPDNSPVQTLYVSIGDRARHDWLAQGTIFDLDGGSLKTVTTGGALRDDRDLCVQVAQIAHQWYGVARAEASFNLRRIDMPAKRGNLITSIGDGDATEAINAIVSQVTINFSSQSTSLMAGFAELNFAGLV